MSWCKFTWALSVVLLDIVRCFNGVARVRLVLKGNLVKYSRKGAEFVRLDRDD